MASVKETLAYNEGRNDVSLRISKRRQDIDTKVAHLGIENDLLVEFLDGIALARPAKVQADVQSHLLLAHGATSSNTTSWVESQHDKGAIAKGRLDWWRSSIRQAEGINVHLDG